MKIGMLAPSIYMSTTRFSDMIFAPRDLVVSLTDGLVEKGHEVHFFTAGDIETKAKLVPGDETLLHGKFKEAKLAAGESERLKWASFYGLKKDYEMDLTQRCYKMGLEGKLDVIHSYHDNIAHYFDELTGFPTVYTLHDPLPVEKDDIRHWFFSKFAHQSYVSISDSFRKHGSINVNFVDTVYHGLGLSEYPYVEKADNYLTAMGRMVPQKGLDDAVDVSSKLDIPLKLATSDLKTNTHLAYYKDVLGPKIDKNEKVELTGFMSDAKKAEYLGRAKAFMFPIKWEEPFGMVMIESMACGTPVIAYGNGSVPEIIVDGVTGFIVEPDNINSKLEIRNPKINHKSQIQNMNKENNWIIRKKGIEGLVEAVKRIGEIDRAGCRKHVEENFSVEKMVENYIKVYAKVIASKIDTP
ncbi:glycosyltransferase family 4 protein [Patescibacteria group bacterium]